MRYPVCLIILAASLTFPALAQDNANVAVTAQAADTVPHQLVVRLPDGVIWRQDIVTHREGAGLLASDAPLPITESLTASFSYILKVRDGGFSISRRTLTYDETTPLDIDYPDLAKIRQTQTMITNDLDYGTDVNLKPRSLDNWSEVQSRSHALFVEKFGEEMAAIDDLELAENPDLKDQPQKILADSLMLENLMAELYLQPHIIGTLSPPHRNVLTSSLTGEALPADVNVSLVSWDETSARAIYSLSVEPVAEAKADAVTHYLYNLLYPLNTMDESDVDQLRTNVTKAAAKSIYIDSLTCRLSANITTGLVTSGDCRKEMHFTMPMHSENMDWRISLTQTLSPSYAQD